MEIEPASLHALSLKKVIRCEGDYIEFKVLIWIFSNLKFYEYVKMEIQIYDWDLF